MKYLVVFICLISAVIAATQLNEAERYSTKSSYSPYNDRHTIDCNQMETSTKKLGYVKLYGHYYYFSTDKKSWLSARFTCRNQGGGSDFISIENHKENKAIADYLYSKYDRQVFWTGGSDSEREGIWTWAHNGKSMNYTNWARGQPSASVGHEDCMTIGGKGEKGYWNDEHCLQEFQYICELQYPVHCKQLYANSAGIISNALLFTLIAAFLSQAAKM